MKRSLVALLGILTLPLMAQSGWYNPCSYGCYLQGDWEFGAQALLYSPMLCEYDFAKETEAGGRLVEVYSAECNPHWGVRAFGLYTAGCNFLKASYQWYEASAKRNAVGDLEIRDTTLNFATVNFSRFFRYQNADVRLGGYLYNGPQCSFYLFGNARWVDLKFHRRLRGVVGGTGPDAADAVIFSERAEVGGGAGGVGGGARIPVFCGLGVYGEINGLGLIANRRNNDTYIDDGMDQEFFPLVYKKQTCISAEGVFRLGLDYTHTGPCWTLTFDLGYEVDYFWNPFALPFDKGSQQLRGGGWERVCENVGVSGLYFGASYRY